MVIDIDRVNATVPYAVTPTGQAGFFQFVTDFGVSYRMGFLPSDLLETENTYEFVLANLNNRKSPNDPKLKQTILTLIYSFFQLSDSILLYLCETGDDRQSLRSRLFESWFKSSSRQTEFLFLSATVADEDGVLNYIAVILRRDHPDLPHIKAEFTRNVEMFREKPDNISESNE